MFKELQLMADNVISGIRRGIAGIIKRQRRLKRLRLARYGGSLKATEWRRRRPEAIGSEFPP
jgi:hypothetical protein